jgi:hypothetical protein
MRNPSSIACAERNEIILDKSRVPRSKAENFHSVKIARRVTARFAAFIPGASPPLVKTAIRFNIEF